MSASPKSASRRGVHAAAVRTGAGNDAVAQSEIDVHFDPDDWDSIKDQQDAIIADAELADRLFEDKREAFEVAWYLGSMQKIEVEQAAASSQPWTPQMLYEKDVAHRRVMALEMFAWVVVKVENFATRSDASEFQQELMDTRALHWGRHPWSWAAKGNDAYLNHLRNMGNVFANASPPDVEYSNRRRQPFGAGDSR